MSDAQPAASAPLPATPVTPPGVTGSLPAPGPAGILAALAVTHVATAAMVLAGPGGGAVAAALALDALLALALAGAAAAAVLRRPLPASAVAGLLVACGVAAGVRAVAGGEPLLAATAALVAVAALAVGGRTVLLGVVAAVVGAAVAGAGAAAVRSGQWSDAGLVATLVAGAALTAVALRRATSAQVDAADAALRAAQEQRVHDALTGVLNRRGLELMAVPMIEHARRRGEAVHALFVDIDGFSAVNAEVGWSRGDLVLAAVAEALRGSARTTDVVCRFGGDEFVVLGPGTGTSPLELERRMRAILADAPPVADAVWPSALSIGSATLVPWDEGDLGALVARADQDMQLRRQLRRQSKDRRGDLATPPAAPDTPRTPRTEV